MSPGFGQVYEDLERKRLEDMVAAVALDRAGPRGTGMGEGGVNRVHGRAKAAYPHPDLEDVRQLTSASSGRQRQT